VPVAKSQEKVEKESQQIKQTKTGNAWIEPRMDMHGLLDFLDINVWHRRCVNLKANIIVGKGWELITDDKNKDPDADYNRLHDWLSGKTGPNEHHEDTFTELSKRLQVDYHALGNGYFEASRNLKATLAQLYHPRGVTMRRDRQIRNGYWQIIGARSKHFNPFGGDRSNGENEILHYYNYDPKSDYYGIPDWYPSLADMVQDKSIVDYNINLFRHQLMSKFAIIVEGGRLSKTARQNLKQFVQNNYTGIQNAGRTIVLDTEDPNVKIKIEKLEVSIGDKSNQKDGMRNQSRDLVIGAHGVPPRILGIMNAAQLGGTGEVDGQLEIFKKTFVDPEQSSFEEWINNTITPALDPGKWKIKFKEFEVRDLKALADYWTKALDPKTGWANRPEAREEMHYSKEEDISSKAGNKGNQQSAVGKALPVLSKELESLRKSLELSLIDYEEL